MLFAQIAAFILVMVIFTAYRPEGPTLPATSSILACGVILAALWVGCRFAVVLFLNRVAGPKSPPDPAKAAHRMFFYLNAAGVLAFALMVTQADLKAQLVANFRVFAASESASGLAAIVLYVFCLAAVWWAAHPVERAVLNNHLPLGRNIAGQLRFVAPVIFPWVIMAGIRDVVALFSPGLAAWLDTSVGDLVFLLGFVVILSLVFPVAVKSWWGCRPVPPGPLRELAETVLQRAQVRVAGILNWPILEGRLLTAGILGVVRPARYLLITPGLAESLDMEAMAAVVAHEAGHVRHRHILWYLGLFLGFFFLAYALVEPLSLLVSALVYWASHYEWGLAFLSGGSADAGLAGVILALPLLACLLLYIRFVLGFFMRHYERQADFYALRLMGGPEPLARALSTIADLSGNSHNVPSWHHFSVAQRINALRAAQREPSLVRRQARLIKKGLAVYVAGMLAMGGLAAASYHSDPTAGMRAQVTERLLAHRVAQGPVSPRLRMTLGIYRFEQGKEKLALKDLARAYELAPADPEVLNSLAWVLLTARDKTLRRPAEGLILARRAVALSPKAHIFDTLAQAFFENGQPEKAVAAARAALSRAKKNRQDYYRKQLAKFARAAGRPG